MNISLGPTGELRYPSYNQNDGWKFPDRGNFQAYSPLARTEFRNFALSSFGGLSGVSQRWGINLPNADAIRPPGGDDQTCSSSKRRAESFVGGDDHNDMQYGKDVIDWYNDSLVEHGRRVLLAAHQAFGGSMQSIPLGMKIPGVHWQMLDCSRHPRIAEITTGLVQTTLNLQPVDEARADAYGYKNILDMVTGVKNQSGRDIILHFTAVEMDNDVACGTDPDRSPNSMAEALVFWISHGAEDRNIKHKSENALACIETPGDDRTWDLVRNAFTFAPYRGLSLLRLVRTSPLGCSSPNVAWDTDKGQYQSFIQDFVGANKPNLTVHLAEWESCIEPQCNFNVHTFGGNAGTFPLSFEGEFNGRFWWVGTIPNAADTFSFTFNNSRGWEGSASTFDRLYKRGFHHNELFALGRINTEVFTQRP